MSNKFIDLLTERIKELIKIYEDYIWKKDNRRLVTIFQNRMIYFYLYDEDNELKDEIFLKFDNRESKLYNYMCIKVFLILFGNVLVNRDNNVFYTNSYKNYLGLVIYDGEVLENISKLATINRYEIVNDDNPIVVSYRKCLKRRYDLKFIDKLSERIKVSSECLRGD